MNQRRFRYAADPLCLLCVGAYVWNRIWSPSEDLHWLFASYFGDFLLIPCALPVLLWLQRKLRLRSHDQFPSLKETAATCGLWSLLFEGVFPYELGLGVSDAADVVAYVAGAMVAALWWSAARRRMGADVGGDVASRNASTMQKARSSV